MDQSIPPNHPSSKTMDTDTETNVSERTTNVSTENKLYDKWTLWAHLPHDTNWTFESYIRILTFNTVEEIIMLLETLPNEIITNCMLFIMRDGIKPMWEDPKNVKGGCFSYKINNKNVVSIWKNLSYSLVGESLTEQSSARPAINGITISPKKNFCIVKIWFSNCNYQNPSIIIDDVGISSQGCLFKTHISA
jgi:translation initiation factor 4E